VRLSPADYGTILLSNRLALPPIRAHAVRRQARIGVASQHHVQLGDSEARYGLQACMTMHSVVVKNGAGRTSSVPRPLVRADGVEKRGAVRACSSGRGARRACE
jgi:hypothetical protein